MTRSIIRQLISKHIPETLVKLWKDDEEYKREPDHNQLSAALEEIIDSHPADRVFLIFDALDECPENGLYTRDLLFRLLTGLLKAAGQKIHLLATSRFEEGIRCHLKDSVRIDIEERMNDDVRALLDYEHNQRLKKWAEFKPQIDGVLLKNNQSRGFRWTELQI